VPGGLRVGVHLGFDAHPLVGEGSPLRNRVRTMKPGDLEGVMAIEETSFPTPWSRGMFLEELSRGFSDPVVVEGEGGEILGFAVSWTVAEEAHLLNIAVRPDRRRGGIGRALLRECIRRGARAGATRIHLEVRAGNEAARRFYRAAGFSFLGIRKGYYTDTGEDAVLLARELRETDAV